MSRLYDILNGIVAPFGKELWSGTWTSGTITVPNSDKYLAFIIDQAGTPLIAVRSGRHIRAMGITGYAENRNQLTRMFAGTISGTTWTFSYSRYLQHDASSSHTVAADSNVTRIVGLIPNWGG